MKARQLILLALAGCASNSGVVPAGQDTYLVSREAASGFAGLGTLKADALRQADAYCQGLHKAMKVISATESQPPYVFGNFPRAEVQFMCLSAGDARISGSGN